MPEGYEPVEEIPDVDKEGRWSKTIREFLDSDDYYGRVLIPEDVKTTDQVVTSLDKARKWLVKKDVCEKDEINFHQRGKDVYFSKKRKEEV